MTKLQIRHLAKSILKTHINKKVRNGIFDIINPNDKIKVLSLNGVEGNILVIEYDKICARLLNIVESAWPCKLRGSNRR